MEASLTESVLVRALTSRAARVPASSAGSHSLLSASRSWSGRGASRLLSRARPRGGVQRMVREDTAVEVTGNPDVVVERAVGSKGAKADAAVASSAFGLAEEVVPRAMPAPLTESPEPRHIPRDDRRESGGHRYPAPAGGGRASSSGDCDVGGPPSRHAPVLLRRDARRPATLRELGGADPVRGISLGIRRVGAGMTRVLDPCINGRNCKAPMPVVWMMAGIGRAVRTAAAS